MSEPNPLEHRLLTMYARALERADPSIEWEPVPYDPGQRQAAPTPAQDTEEDPS